MRVFNNSNAAVPVGRTVIPAMSEAFVDDAYLLTPWAKRMKRERILVFPYYGTLPWEKAPILKAGEEEILEPAETEEKGTDNTDNDGEVNY
jgi:hypothetical protein